MNAVGSGSTPSQVQPTTNIEDDNDIDMNTEAACYPSPITGEN
jgi:hypothetical protein